MYDAFTPNPDNAEPYDAIPPNVNLTERNTAASPNAAFSRGLPLDYTDRTPQRYLDRILWQYVHGADSEPPPPGPNASGLDEEAWERAGKAGPEEAEAEEAGGGRGGRVGQASSARRLRSAFHPRRSSTSPASAR